MDSCDAGDNGLGDMLRCAREARGLTIEAIARETRIPRRHLEALEHDDLTAAPGGFYQRAELRTYARLVGVDQDRALAKLESELKATPSAIAAVEIQAPPTAPALRAYVPAVLGLVVLATALLGAIVSSSPVLPTQGQAPRRPDSSSASAKRLLPPPAPAEASQRAHSPEAVSVATGPTPVHSAVAPADVLQASAERVTREHEFATEPAPADASVAQITELVVATRPAGATVTVNGVAWGTSPVTIRYLTPGDKRIRVSKDQYAAEERVFHVSEGGRQAVDIPLTSVP